MATEAGRAPEMSSIPSAQNMTLKPQSSQNFSDPFRTPARSTATPTESQDTSDEPPIDPDTATYTIPPANTTSDGSTEMEPVEPTLSFPRHVTSSSEPPSLNYTLKGRKRWIAIFWTLIVVDSIGIPLAVYFGLWYGVGPGLCPPPPPGASHGLADCPEAKLNANAVFSISTACLGGVSIFEYGWRFYKLWRKGSNCRVIGARRAYLDWFHWNFSIAWAFIMVELIVGTIPDWPPIRLLAMPASSLLFWFAFQLLVEDTLRIMGKRQPIRISSVPKGAHFRPGIYSIIEDVVAVDGSGGTEFRTALNERYEQSHYFRQMLHRLTLFWAAGSMGAAVVTTILVFTLERNASYIVGWCLPFVWAGIWAFMTIWYVKRELKHERHEWGKPNAMRNAGRYSIDVSRLEAMEGETHE